MPELFHLDNFDLCLSMNRSALYCSITFQLDGMDGNSEIFRIIHETNADRRNYRHDQIRHGVCVNLTCPEVDGVDLVSGLERCYSKKYEQLQLKGRITEIRCETQASPYEFNIIDKFVLYFLKWIRKFWFNLRFFRATAILYTLLVFLATFLDSNNEYSGLLLAPIFQFNKKNF